MMIQLPPAVRARLYLSMCEALDVSDIPNSQEEAKRLALAQLVSGFTAIEGKCALHEVFRLAETLDYWLIDFGGDGPHGFNLGNVARLVGGDRALAKAALLLIGARPTHLLDGSDNWATEPTTSCVSIRFPADLLVERVQCELEEAEQFIAN